MSEEIAPWSLSHSYGIGDRWTTEVALCRCGAEFMGLLNYGCVNRKWWNFWLHCPVRRAVALKEWRGDMEGAVTVGYVQEDRIVRCTL